MLNPLAALSVVSQTNLERRGSAGIAAIALDDTEIVTVGAGGAATVKLADALALPPDPEHDRV